MIIFFIFLSYWLGLSFKFCWYIFAVILFLFFIFLLKRYSKKIALLCLSISAIGIGVSFINFSFERNSYIGMVYEVKDNYFLLNSNFEKFYVYEKNNTKEIGDIITVSGTTSNLDFTLLESGFDFKDYLNKKGVYKQLTLIESKTNFSSPLKLHQLKKNFLNNFDDETAALVSSILFSQSQESDVTDSIRDLHLGKFLVSNGTYINIYISLLCFLISKLVDKKWAKLVSIVVLQIYLIFVFHKFAVIRICFLFILRWINKYLLKNKFSYLQVISISALFFLLMNKNLAMQDSFILGYSIPIVFNFSRKAFSHKGKILKKVLPVIFLYLFMVPFELDFYNGLAPFSMIFQFLLSPIFILIGILSLACFLKFPTYSLVKILIELLFKIVKILNPINLEIHGPPLNPVLTFVYFILFFAILYYLEIGFKPIWKNLITLQIAFGSIYFFPINNLLSSSVTFLNVGQGDSCLIRHKQTTIMIDAGGLTYSDIAKENLIPYLKKNRIYEIDLLITTHDDFDHSGGVESLTNNFKVRNLINSYSSFPLSIGGITFNNYNNHIDDSSDENAKSLVVGFSLMKKQFLIMGDATTQIESYIMKEYPSLKCDVLKVGHHGSDTSSSYSFLKFVEPEDAIISVGKKNKYGHPSKKVIDNLSKLGINIKRTDLLGSITYKSYL